MGPLYAARDDRRCSVVDIGDILTGASVPCMEDGAPHTLGEAAFVERVWDRFTLTTYRTCMVRRLFVGAQEEPTHQHLVDVCPHVRRERGVVKETLLLDVEGVREQQK